VERQIRRAEKQTYKGITKVFSEIVVDPGCLSVIIHDIPKSNWGIRGKQASNL